MLHGFCQYRKGGNRWHPCLLGLASCFTDDKASTGVKKHVLRLQLQGKFVMQLDRYFNDAHAMQKKRASTTFSIERETMAFCNYTG